MISSATTAQTPTIISPRRRSALCCWPRMASIFAWRSFFWVLALATIGSSSSSGWGWNGVLRRGILRMARSRAAGGRRRGRSRPSSRGRTRAPAPPPARRPPATRRPGAVGLAARSPVRTASASAISATDAGAPNGVRSAGSPRRARSTASRAPQPNMSLPSRPHQGGRTRAVVVARAAPGRRGRAPPRRAVPPSLPCASSAAPASSSATAGRGHHQVVAVVVAAGR